VWDDHEFADDAWREGADAHRAAFHGPFSMRKKAAMQAWHEWMPIRANPQPGTNLHRSFDLGVCSLHMLDTRIVGRDQQIVMDAYYGEEGEFDCGRFCDDVHSPKRQMIGRAQMAWLERSVRQSRHVAGVGAAGADGAHGVPA